MKYTSYDQLNGKTLEVGDILKFKGFGDKLEVKKAVMIQCWITLDYLQGK